MIKVLFKEKARYNGGALANVDVITEKGPIHTFAGRLVLTEDAWESLSAMLIHGATFYQDDEATIEIERLTSTHAYLEGADA